jgi:tetratricopeptide (TPR) repeat protein
MPGNEQMALRLARDMGAGFVVTGAVYARADSVVLQSRILDTESGELARAVEEVTGLLSDPTGAVETMRQRTLGAVATLTDPRLASWASPGDQPPGLESYRLLAAGFDRFFTAGQRLQLGTDNSEATRLNRQAAVLFVEAAGTDSSFVAPLLWATFAYSNTGDRAARDSLLQALAQRSGLSAWERALVEFQLADARSDSEEAYRRAQALVELSPETEWSFLLGYAANNTRRYRTAINVLEGVDPDLGWIKDFPSYWHLRVVSRHSLGDHAKELEDVGQLRARFPGDRDVGRMELVALAALGRSDELLAGVREAVAIGDRRVTVWLDWVAQELLAHGHSNIAREVLEVGLAHFNAFPTGGDRVGRAARARLLQVAGMHDEAQSAWEQLLELNPESDVYRARLGILAARSGDRAKARRIDAWLAEFGTRTGSVVFELNGGALAWRARIAAQLNEPDLATALIREALDRGWPNSYPLLHAMQDLEPLFGHAGFSAVLRPLD